MRIARRFAVVLTTLTVCLLAGRVFAGSLTPTLNPATPNAATVTYDPANGNLSYAGNGTLITTMELKSASNLFDPSKLDSSVVAGPFDFFGPNKFFQLIPAGTDGQNFGQVLPAGLTSDGIFADIEIDGSIKPAGKLPAATGGGPYLYVVNVVPEPTSLALVFCGLLGLLGLRRK